MTFDEPQVCVSRGTIWLRRAQSREPLGMASGRRRLRSPPVGEELSLLSASARSAEDFEKDRLAADVWLRRSADSADPRSRHCLRGVLPPSHACVGTFLDDLDGAQMQALLPALFRALDAARDVDLSASTGLRVWRPNGRRRIRPTWRAALLDVANDWPGSRTHGWRDRLSASPTGPGPFELALSASPATWSTPVPSSGIWSTPTC